MRKSNGPKTEACGTPVKISRVVDASFSITTKCLPPLQVRYEPVFCNPSNTIMIQFCNEYIMANCIKSFFQVNKNPCNIFIIF